MPLHRLLEYPCTGMLHSILHPNRASALQTPLRAEGEFHHLQPVGCFPLYFLSCSTTKALKLLLQRKMMPCPAMIFLLPQTHPLARGLSVKQKGQTTGETCLSEKEGKPGVRFLLRFAPSQARGNGERRTGSQHRKPPPVPRTWRFPCPLPAAAWALPLESINKGKGK